MEGRSQFIGANGQHYVAYWQSILGKPTPPFTPLLHFFQNQVQILTIIIAHGLAL
jgi:hypothetical protein